MTPRFSSSPAESRSWVMPWSGATPALSYTSYTVLRAPVAAGGEQWEY